MKKQSLTRWILINKEGELELQEREVSGYMPINRMISEVGFYPFDPRDLFPIINGSC